MKPIIFGLRSTELTKEEEAFFKENKPMGFILLHRNCDSAVQIQNLIQALKNLHENYDPMILIDEEGGRVSRLRSLYNQTPAVGSFLEHAHGNIAQAKKETAKNYKIIATRLRDLGINTNCAPVCDLFIEGADKIIGNRAFADNPKQVAILAKVAADTLLKYGVKPIIKHIPGHGRAVVDSHESLPIIHDSLADLQESDFAVFKELVGYPIAMTAHIVFTALDKNNPVTFSKKAIDYIKNTIGFKGLIMTDDLSMKALRGNFTTRAEKAYKSGCDILLHCNADMDEMEAIIKAKLEK
jgi:beta-N-acetylhexosaminidase